MEIEKDILFVYFGAFGKTMLFLKYQFSVFFKRLREPVQNILRGLSKSLA